MMRRGYMCDEMELGGWSVETQNSWEINVNVDGLTCLYYIYTGTLTLKMSIS